MNVTAKVAFTVAAMLLVFCLVAMSLGIWLAMWQWAATSIMAGAVGFAALFVAFTWSEDPIHEHR